MERGQARIFEARQLPNFDCLGHDLAESAVEVLGGLAEAPASSEELLRAIGRIEAREEFSWFRVECPFGAAVLATMRAIACAFFDFDAEACQVVERLERGPNWSPIDLPWDPYGLSTAGALPVFLNSRWALLFCDIALPLRELAFETNAAEGLRRFLSHDFNCLQCAAAGSRIGWCHALELLKEQFRLERPTWYEFLFVDVSSELMKCPLGTIALLTLRLTVFSGMFPDMYHHLALNIEHVLDISMPELRDMYHREDIKFDLSAALVYTEWPLLPGMCQSARMVQHVPGSPTQRRSVPRAGQVQHKPFKLDFWPEELVRRKAGSSAVPADDEPVAQRLAARLRQPMGPSTQQVLRALSTSLSKTRGSLERRLVLVTMLWGERLSAYLGAWLRRVDAFGHSARMLIFCLDVAALDACRAAHRLPDLCVAGAQQNAFSKFALVSVVLQAGFDLFFLDFDTVLMRDPLPHLFGRVQSVDMLVSRDYGTDCLNVGLFYMKAKEAVVQFVEALLLWMWHNPHDNDQRAFSALLGVVDLQDEEAFGKLITSTPRWGYLEPLNAFVTNIVYFKDLEGWTGDLQKILIYHFLDGTGGVDERAVYINHFDLFYHSEAIDLGDAKRPLWQQDARIRERLLLSRHSGPPRALRGCEAVETLVMPAWKRRRAYDRERRRALHAALGRARDWRPV